LQLGLNGLGEVGLHFPDMADDAAGVDLVVPERSDFRHGINVIREREDRRLHGIDDRFGDRSIVQRRAKPMQSGVVGKQQIVLGGEVAIEGPQRYSGVRRDLLGRGVLDTLAKNRTSAAWRSASRVRSLRAV
jgi:hypothetical protein